MSIDDILLWIAKKSETLFKEMLDNMTKEETWLELKGSYDILQELREHILIETNPHKREDIEKYKLARNKLMDDAK